MRRSSLKDSGDRGWFIGDFAKAAFPSKDFEICYQKNPRGKTDSHVHKLITEITLIISGQQLCNGEIFGAGEICVLAPGDNSQIEYLEETEVITIKTPSIPSDKYLL
jgi:hypothetical protein